MESNQTNKIPSHYSLRARKPTELTNVQNLGKPNLKRKAKTNNDCNEIKKPKIPAKVKKVTSLNVVRDNNDNGHLHNQGNINQNVKINKTPVDNHYQSTDEEDVSNSTIKHLLPYTDLSQSKNQLPTNPRSILRSPKSQKKTQRVSWNPNLVEEKATTSKKPSASNSKPPTEDFDFHFNQILEVQLDTNGPKVIVEPVETDIFSSTISNLLLQPINRIEDVPIQAEFQSRLNANEDLHDIMDSFLSQYEEEVETTSYQ